MRNGIVDWMRKCNMIIDETCSGIFLGGGISTRRRIRSTKVERPTDIVTYHKS